MTIFYNSKTGGFYDTDIHAVIPEGSIEITAAEHSALLEGQSKGQSIAADRSGRPVNRAPAEPNLEEYKVIAKAQIENTRAAEEAKGLTYVFPDGVTDVVQLRNLRDFFNIQSQVTKAQLLAASETSTLIPFQAMSNTTHMLTPQEMILMGVAVSDYCSALYAKSWMLKAAVDMATTKAAVDQAKVWVNI